MRSVDMDEAKTHFSSLVDAAAEGNPFIITRAGKPAVKVIAVEAQVSGETRRLGFLAGRISVPDEDDRMGSADEHFLGLAFDVK